MKARNRKNPFEFFLLFVLIGFIATQFLPNLLQSRQETIEIAIAAPLTYEEDAITSIGQGAVDGAQLYIDRINKMGGINGKKIELKVYDDRFQSDVAANVAREIGESQAVAAIGHYTSNSSLAAGKVYQEYGIPAVSPSATAPEVTDSPWYFRTIYNNIDQGKFIANYVRHIFASKNVYLIYGNDVYGSTLGQEVIKSFNAFGQELLGIQQLGDNLQQSVSRIVLDLLRLKRLSQEPDIIIIVTQNDEASQIIRSIRRDGIDYPIVGGGGIADVSFANSFIDTVQEQITPGFFSNDVHAISPALLDIADEDAQKFKSEFELRYGYSPGWISIFNYDAAHAIIRGINNAIDRQESEGIEGDFFQQDIATIRRKVRVGLTEINSSETAIQGLTRDFYFNDKGDTRSQIFMGLFSRRNFISAFTQLYPLGDLDLIPDLEEKIQRGDIFKVGGRYQQKTNIVYTALDINEVNNIDEKSSSYLIDFYLWFRYKGDIQPDDIEFINYSVTRLDSGEKLSLGDPIHEGTENGINYVVYRVKADFYEEFDFHQYPFDRQILSIRFRHNTLTRDGMIYVVDFVGMRDTNTEEVIENFKKNRVFGRITDWHVTNAVFFQNTNVTQSTLGFRRLIDADTQFQYSQFNAVIEIQRDILRFSIKNLLPLWFFVAASYFLMFLPFKNISIEAISGLLLAVVFYHLSLLDALPDGIGYVVALDYAFYLIYTLIGLELLLVILGYSKWLKRLLGITQHQLIQFGKIAFPIVWTGGCVTLYALYL